jgi:hypothetical protein
MSMSQEVKGKKNVKISLYALYLANALKYSVFGQRTFLEPDCAELYIVVRMAVHFKCVPMSKLVHAITSSCLQGFLNNMNLVFFRHMFIMRLRVMHIDQVTWSEVKVT